MREDNFYAGDQSDDKNETAGEIAFKFNKEGNCTNYARHYEPSSYRGGAAVAALIEEYASDHSRGRARRRLHQKFLQTQIGRDGFRDGKYQADVAIINTGGVRGLARGPIRVKTWRVSPFVTPSSYRYRQLQLKELYGEQKQFCICRNLISTTSTNMKHTESR